MKFHVGLAFFALALLGLSGCGQTGALYLPEDVPAATQDTATTTQSPDTDTDTEGDSEQRAPADDIP